MTGDRLITAQEEARDLHDDAGRGSFSLAQPLPVILETFSMHRGKLRIDDPTLPRYGTDSIPLDLSIDAPVFSECKEP